MKRPFTPKVVTANRLLEGDVVYLAADGSWTGTHEDAALLTEADAADARLKDAEAQPGVVVGPYLADAEATPDGPRPIHFREAFRTRGPSNYAHGKQAAR